MKKPFIYRLDATCQKHSVTDYTTKVAERDVVTQAFVEDDFIDAHIEQEYKQHQRQGMNKAILIFSLSLALTIVISLISLYIFNRINASSTDKIHQLTAIVMKAAALGNSDHAHELLKIARIMAENDQQREQIESLSSFVTIAGAVRKIDRWNSGKKYLMSEKMLSEIRKLEISANETELLQALEKRELKLQARKVENHKTPMVAKMATPILTQNEIAKEWVSLLYQYQLGNKRDACEKITELKNKSASDQHWQTKIAAFIDRRCIDRT